MENFSFIGLRGNTMENNNNNRIRKVLFEEVSLITSVIAIAIGVVLFISGPDARLKQDIALIQQDINIIKTNELVHIQNAVDQNYLRSEENKEMINQINLKLERIITILEK